MPVSAVFENLEAGATVDEITEWFHISKEQVVEVLEFAARSVAAPVPLESVPASAPDARLFDHSDLRRYLPFLIGHTVAEARTRGWDTLSNGELLAEAERAGFEVFLTADKNIRYQQNLADPNSPRSAEHSAMAAGSIAHCERIVAAINAVSPGSYMEVRIPDRS